MPLCFRNLEKNLSRRESAKIVPIILKVPLFPDTKSHRSDEQAYVVVLCTGKFEVSNKLVSAKIEDEKLRWTFSDVVDYTRIEHPKLLTFVDGNPQNGAHEVAVGAI